MKNKLLIIMLLALSTVFSLPTLAKETGLAKTKATTKTLPCDDKNCIKGQTKNKDADTKPIEEEKIVDADEVPEEEDIICPDDCGKDPYKIDYPHPDRTD